MKDIYSPLEIDEQWDQRAPMLDGEPGEGMATAVAAPMPSETIPELTTTEQTTSDSIAESTAVEVATEPEQATTAAGADLPPEGPPLDPPEDDNTIDPTVANDKDNTVEPSESFRDMSDTPASVTDPSLPTETKDVPAPPADPIDSMSQHAAQEAMRKKNDSPDIIVPTLSSEAKENPKEVVTDNVNAPLEAGDFHQEFGDTEPESDALEKVDSELQEALDTLEAEDARVEQELERLHGEITERQTNIGLLEARRDKTQDRIKTLRAMLNGPLPEDSGK